MYGRSFSPSPYHERGYSNFSRSLYDSDLMSSISPRNRSIQRIIDTDFSIPDRSRSLIRSSNLRPLTSVLTRDPSPVLRRKDYVLPSTKLTDSCTSPTSWLSGDDIKSSPKPRSYYDFPSTSTTRFSSYTSTFRKPQRTDYSDYLRPALTTRPTIKSGYTPRPRAEREDSYIPLIRERKLIKFREFTNDILTKVKRKVSWDLPEEIDSPLINEMRNKESTGDTEEVHRRDSLVSYSPKESRSRDCSLNRLGVKKYEPCSDSSSPCPSRRSSGHSMDMSPRNLRRLTSPKLKDIESVTEPINSLNQVLPPPRKKSLGSIPRMKKGRKSSIESLTADERSLNYSIIADKIRRSRESPEKPPLPPTSNLQPSSPSQPCNEASLTDESIGVVVSDVIDSDSRPTRLRRRRRISNDLSEQEKDEGTHTRERSRQRLESTKSGLSPEETKLILNETPQPVHRTHRKSVKLKANKQLQASSKNSNEDFNSVSTAGKTNFIKKEAKENLFNECESDILHFNDSSSSNFSKSVIDKNVKEQTSISHKANNALYNKNKKLESSNKESKDGVTCIDKKAMVPFTSVNLKQDTENSFLKDVERTVSHKPDLKHTVTQPSADSVHKQNEVNIHKISPKSDITIKKGNNNIESKTCLKIDSPKLDTLVKKQYDNKNSLSMTSDTDSSETTNRYKSTKGVMLDKSSHLNTNKSLPSDTNKHSEVTSTKTNYKHNSEGINNESNKPGFSTKIPKEIVGVKNSSAEVETTRPKNSVLPDKVTISDKSKTQLVSNSTTSNKLLLRPQELNLVIPDITKTETLASFAPKHKESCGPLVNEKDLQTFVPEISKNEGQQCSNHDANTKINSNDKRNKNIKNLALQEEFSKDKKFPTESKPIENIRNKEPNFLKTTNVPCDSAVLKKIKCPTKTIEKSSSDGIRSINDKTCNLLKRDSIKSISLGAISNDEICSSNTNKKSTVLDSKKEINSNLSKPTKTEKISNNTQANDLRPCVSGENNAVEKEKSTTSFSSDKKLNSQIGIPKEPFANNKISNNSIITDSNKTKPFGEYKNICDTSNNKGNSNISNTKAREQNLQDTMKTFLPKAVNKDEEIVVVCKLPQPKKTTVPKQDSNLIKTIPADQNIEVSIVKGPKNIILSEKEFENKNKSLSTQVIIPKKTLPVPKGSVLEPNAVLDNKIENDKLKRISKNSNKVNEQPEVSVVHTIVLKAKPQLKISNKTTQNESKAISCAQLDSIPDIIQSTIGSKNKSRDNNSANLHHTCDNQQLNSLHDTTKKLEHDPSDLKMHEIVSPSSLEQSVVGNANSKGKNALEALTKPDLIQMKNKIINAKPRELESISHEKCKVKVADSIIKEKANVEIETEKTKNNLQIQSKTSTPESLKNNSVEVTKLYQKSKTLPNVPKVLEEKMTTLNVSLESGLKLPKSENIKPAFIEKKLNSVAERLMPDKDSLKPELINVKFQVDQTVSKNLSDESLKVCNTLSENSSETVSELVSERSELKSTLNLDIKSEGINLNIQSVDTKKTSGKTELSTNNVAEVKNVQKPNKSIPPVGSKSVTVSTECPSEKGTLQNFKSHAVKSLEYNEDQNTIHQSKTNIAEQISSSEIHKVMQNDTPVKQYNREITPSEHRTNTTVAKAADDQSAQIRKTSKNESKLPLQKLSKGEELKNTSGLIKTTGKDKDIQGPDLITSISNASNHFSHGNSNLQNNIVNKQSSKSNEATPFKDVSLKSNNSVNESPALDIIATIPTITERSYLSNCKTQNKSFDKQLDKTSDTIPSKKVSGENTKNTNKGIGDNSTNSVLNLEETKKTVCNDVESLTKPCSDRLSSNNFTGNKSEVCIISNIQKVSAENKASNKDANNNSTSSVLKLTNAVNTVCTDGADKIKPCSDQINLTNVNENKSKSDTGAVSNTIESTINKPRHTKPPPVKKPPVRYGLFVKPKEVPCSRESSSSDSDSSSSWSSESSDDDDRPTKNVPLFSRNRNQKIPDEKVRSRSRTSVDSSISSVTTTTTFSTSSAEGSPRERKIDQKLRFRKYGIEDFTFLKLLGKGSFGKVLLAELKGQGMYFAIKCLKKDVVLEDDDVESTMIERRVLALGTQHPYMCKLYCTFQTKSYLFFVMEFLNGGDLMFHIQERRFDVKRAMFYGAEIVSALKFLHKRGIVYRDIKLDNVMLDEEGHIRLVDFGMCECRVYGEECMPCNFCGTPTYIAPEIILGKRYNQSVDWWSFGVLLFEMLAGRSPFVGTDEDELFWSICNEEPVYPPFLPADANKILKSLLVKNPTDRLGMPGSPHGEIQEHPFFSTIDWDKLEKKQLPPPFKPTVLSECDTGNFDTSFTMDLPVLSPVDSEMLESMDQEQFHGFSYTNPHITD